MLSPDDLDALEETIAILSDDAALQQLAASDAELAPDEGESERELANAMPVDQRYLSVSGCR